MRFGNIRDFQIVRSGQVDVALNIPLRIDHDCLPGFLAANQVRGLGKIVVVDEPKKHEEPS